MFIVIPNLLVSIQRDSEIPIDEKNPNEIFDTRTPQESSVYYGDTAGNAYDVYVSGDYAYVADYSSGLAVIDISDPTNPGTPVYEDTTGVAYGVYVSGDYAYMAISTSGLAIIDISDPTNPGTPIDKDTAGQALDVYVSGDYAYMAIGWNGLAVIDISDPTNPGWPVYEDTNGEAHGVYVSGDYAYLAIGYSGLAVIDISDPTNPGTPFYEDTAGNAYDVYVSGDYAYIAEGSSGLAVLDISNPTNPGPPVYEDTTGSAYGVYVDGDYAYVADGNSGLAVFDISDPTNPGTPVYEDTTGAANGVYLSGNYAYVADRFSGLAIVDISEPINPATPDYEDTTGYAHDVYVSGDYAYVADGASGLAVIDISNPTNPGTPDYENTDGSAWDVYVSGDYAYVADWTYGLAVIDISNPTNPGTPDYEDTSVNARGVYVSGDYAYLAIDTGGLAVIDISDPTNPGTPDYEDTNGIAWGVYVSGDYAYVAADTYGLAVIDISNPTNPGTPIYEDTTSQALDVYVSGDYAYVANGWSGLAVIDISNPTNPGTPVYEPTTGYAYGVFVSGDYAYVADYTAGLAVIDISNPTNPGTPVYEDTSGTASGVYVSGDYAYVADDTSGLAVIQVRQRVDMEDPIISNAPSDFSVEEGYTGQSLSWTATDANPNTYTIELIGTGIVTGPTAWTSGNPINYNIPDGFTAGVFVYIINYTDDYGNFITDSATFTVEVNTAPVINSSADNINVEEGYTGQSLSWIATDTDPDTYTIELQGSGIIVGPSTWSSGGAITYNIPDGYSLGSYMYTANFTDDYGNSITDTVIFTVGDATSPNIVFSTPVTIVEEGYTGQIISWNATDLNPNTYTIEFSETGLVAGPTAWTSGVAITYNIPDGIAVGWYSYTVNFTDDYGNWQTDNVNFTVEIKVIPVINNSPGNINVEFGYTGQSLSWTATDNDPDTYTIELQGSGIIVGPLAWSSGGEITYNIPNGFSLGSYTYTVNFTDDYGNSITDTVIYTVEDTTAPVITFSSNDITIEIGYSNLNISWTATDLFPGTYTIELVGSGVVVGPITWSSGSPISYDIPDEFAPGVYMFNITITDDNGNYASGTITVTITGGTPGGIPFGNTFLIITVISVLGLIFTKKRKIRESPDK